MYVQFPLLQQQPEARERTWVVQRAVVRHPAHVPVLGGVPHHCPLHDPRALPGLRQKALQLLKQWELDVQDPKEFA